MGMHDDKDDDHKAPPGDKSTPDQGPYITLRSLDIEGGLHAKAAPAPAAQPPAAAGLTNVDWLDTFIDELLEGADSSPEALRPIPGRPSPPPAAAKLTEFADISVSRAASTVLGQVLLGYSPIIEPTKGVIATRLTVVPVRASASVDAGALLEAIAEVWPVGGGIVCLNVASERLLSELLRARPATNVLIEVPAFAALDPSHSAALIELARRDCALLLKGRPLRELPREVLPCFKWSIIDTSEERRGAGVEPPRGITRTIPYIQSGVRTMAELRRSFALGAMAVIGWPLHEPIADALDARPDMRVVLDALNRLERGDSAGSVDHVLMRDPVLALELLQHIHSVSDELSVETGSMQHAVSMLGQEQLRQWLARLLSRSSDEITLRPANFAALRRGLLMRMLAVVTGQPEQRGELFMCGVFSLLDRIYARPVGELVRQLALPERVRAALVDRGGPYFPLLELARAIESEVPHDIRAASEAVFVQPIEINWALLRSLLVASHLERPAPATPGQLPAGAAPSPWVSAARSKG
jgi:EAL and modified HD-GYP domain-containing signal transduction protein